MMPFMLGCSAQACDRLRSEPRNGCRGSAAACVRAASSDLTLGAAKPVRGLVAEPRTALSSGGPDPERASTSQQPANMKG